MSEGKHHHIHTQDFKLYVGILVALLFLTMLTVWISSFDFGRWNDVIALGVAGIKASLVILFFMHGRFEGPLTWAFIYYPIIILGTLLAALFLDYGTRNSDDYLVGNVMVKPIHHVGESHDADGMDHSGAETQPPSSGDQPSTDGASASAEDQPAETAPTGGTDTAAVETDTATSVSGWGDLPGDAAAGKAKASMICIACHVVDGVGNNLPGALPFEESSNLARISPDFLRKWFKDPNKVKPGTLMPNFGLSDEEIENLIAFLATYKK